MKINLPHKRTHADSSSQAGEQAQKKAKGGDAASLLHLPADLLETEIIPRLQGHQDGSLAAFALTSSQMRAHSMHAVGIQLLGQIRTAFECKAFDVDPLKKSSENPSAFPTGTLHPGAAAYSALLRLEAFFMARGVITQEEVDHPYRSSGSVEDSLKVVEQAFTQFVGSDKTAKQPVPYATAVCLRDMRAHMQQPLDAWVARTTTEKYHPTDDGPALEEWEAHVLSDTTAKLKNMTMESFQFYIEPVRTNYASTIPPIWMYGANIKHLEISMPLDADLPKVLGHLPALKTLKVCGDVKEKEIDTIVSCLHDRLETLVMDAQALTALPTSLAKLTCLKSLSVCSSALENIDILTQIKPLKSLVFQNCEALEFNDIICALTGLEVLNFEECNLAAVPDKVSNMSSLRRLDVANGINGLPIEVSLCLKDVKTLECLLVLPGSPDLFSQVAEMKSLRFFRQSYSVEIQPDKIGHMVLSGNSYIAAGVDENESRQYYSDWYNALVHS